MADLEAQTEAEAPGSQTTKRLIPRRELIQLIQMLADSVKVVQSIVEVEDQAISNENDKQNVPQEMQTTLKSVDQIAVEGCTADEEKENVSRVIIATPEEIASRKTQNLREFERLCTATTRNEDTMLDPWRAFQHLDWELTSRGYRVAKSRTDANPSEQDVPAIIRHYMENSELRLEVQKELYYGLSRWWWSYSSYIPSTLEIRHHGILDLAP